MLSSYLVLGRWLWIRCLDVSAGKGDLNDANTMQTRDSLKWSQVWLVAVSYFCKMDRNKCIVPACNSLRKNEKVVSIHRLPRNSVTGREWLELCGNEELRNVPYDELTSKRFFI